MQFQILVSHSRFYLRIMSNPTFYVVNNAKNKIKKKKKKKKGGGWGGLE